MTSRKRLLLVLDFAAGNYPSALYAMQQWSQYISQSDEYETVLGPSTFDHRSFPFASGNGATVRDAVLMIANCCPGMTTVYWDRYIDELVLEILHRNGVTPQPFYRDFNYGSAVNRWLLLANEMSCEYILRIDPGTRPPDSRRFDDLMKEHLAEMDSSGLNAVVSRGYEGRLAIRDTFLIQGKAQEQYSLIRSTTGVDPTNQVTGGAMFTSRVPGIPAIPFQKSKKGLTLVWGSDDAFFQLLPATRGSRKLAMSEIPRFDKVGKPKTTIEYYRGVAGMVALSSVIQGHEADAGRKVDAFLDKLIPLLDEEICQKNDKNSNWRESFIRNNIAPDEFIEEIVSGWHNYKELSRDWQSICKLLKGEVFPFIQITK